MQQSLSDAFLILSAKVDFPAEETPLIKTTCALFLILFVSFNTPKKISAMPRKQRR
jgi:hypothetical protein